MMLYTGELKTVAHYMHLFEPWFWSALTVGGVCGFAIGFMTSLQIKVTSPLTHNISGTAKVSVTIENVLICELPVERR